MLNKREYDGSQYVIVNVTRPFVYPYWFPVLPGEEPHTYGSIDEAAEELFDLMEEYGHTTETSPIFKLVPVPTDEVEAAVERVRMQRDPFSLLPYPTPSDGCIALGDSQKDPDTLAKNYMRQHPNG